MLYYYYYLYVVIIIIVIVTNIIIILLLLLLVPVWLDRVSSPTIIEQFVQLKNVFKIKNYIEILVDIKIQFRIPSVFGTSYLLLILRGLI